MRPTRIPVLVGSDADLGTIVRAPLVGLWSAPPRNGAVVEPGSAVGTVTQLGRRFVLVIPEGVSGRVAMTGRPQDAVPLEYGQTLFRVTPFAGRDADSVPENAEASRTRSDVIEVGSPTDGVFYRSSALAAKPYVKVGDRVTTGQAVGLIEVMKTFNPIAYGGAGLPEEAEIVEVLAADGQEVRAGQALFVVKTL
jgi:biotin carboxyl carrier protein